MVVTFSKFPRIFAKIIKKAAIVKIYNQDKRRIVTVGLQQIIQSSIHAIQFKVKINTIVHLYF